MNTRWARSAFLIGRDAESQRGQCIFHTQRKIILLGNAISFKRPTPAPGALLKHGVKRRAVVPIPTDPSQFNGVYILYMHNKHLLRSLGLVSDLFISDEQSSLLHRKSTKSTNILMFVMLKQC